MRQLFRFAEIEHVASSGIRGRCAQTGKLSLLPHNAAVECTFSDTLHII